MSSAGWNVVPAMRIQPMFSPTFTPMGPNTSSCTALAAISSTQAQRFQNIGGTSETRSMSGTPMSANMPCLRKMPKKPPPATNESMLEDDSTITRPKTTRKSVVPSSRK